MLRGRGVLDAVLVRQPGHLPEGPGPLGLDLRRPLLAPVLQQSGKQQRPVVDAVRQPLQFVRQPFEGEIGERRDRVEPELEVLHHHGAASGGGSVVSWTVDRRACLIPAGRPPPALRERRAAQQSPDAQPVAHRRARTSWRSRRSCVGSLRTSRLAASMRHTPVHGLAIVLLMASAPPAAAALRSPGVTSATTAAGTSRRSSCGREPEHRVGMPGGGPDLVEAEQLAVDQRQRAADMAHRRRRRRSRSRCAA